MTLHTPPTPPDLTRNPLAGIAVTVDGPTASGKGTLAKALARHFRLKFLDTGAVYRAVAWQVMDRGQDPADTAAAVSAARTLEFDFRHKGNNEFGVWVGGTEVTDAIRTLEVGTGASLVAVKPEVRALLKDFQVHYAQQWKPLVGVVLDGRDTGARICPEAEVKLFLTANVAERGRRRWLEMQAKGDPTPLEQVTQQVAARDARDAANTIICDDAVVIDGTTLSPAAVLQTAIETVERLTGRTAPANPA